jgi:hypothetical protein
MKRFVSLLLGVSVVVGLVFVAAQAEEKVSKVTALRLPASLDSFYPPKTQQPVHLLRMFALGSLFSGIASDLVENDLQGARGVFEKFKTEYVEISKMVPEWKKEYPVKPVEELGAALKLGDRKKVMAAQEKVGAVCHNCHVKYMPMTQQKYHWGDFSTIKVKDPLSNEEVPFTRLKQYLDSNFAGIGLNIERGQKEKARKQVQGFSARFQALQTTCGRCHTGEIKYYTDEGVQGMIDKLGQTLENPSADPKVAVELVQRIGMESCFKCHLVHVPAALGKSRS